MLTIKLWTLVYTSLFLPMNQDATVVFETKDKVECVANYKQAITTLTLKCDSKDGDLILYLEEKTPELGVTLKTGKILLKLESSK